MPDVSRTRAYYRANARALGDDWHTSLPAEKYEGLDMLMTIEFATRNIQSIATGLVNTTRQQTGLTDGLIITEDSAGIKPYSGIVDGAFSYRGIENPFGNVLEFVDGLIFNDHKVYYCNDWTKWTDEINDNYSMVIGTLPLQGGFISRLNYSEKTPELRLPVAISVLGDTDSYYCDYYVDTTYDYSIPVFGGGYQTQERAGIFHWNCAQTYDSANADVGSRLARSF